MEDTREKSWHITDAPEEYIKTLIKSIVGIEFYVKSLDGAFANESTSY